MKRLNFYPFYEELLSSKQKTTTLRIGNSDVFLPGEIALLSIGWDRNKATDLHKIEITQCYEKKISELANHDFDGESPDCKSIAAAQLVLSCIYKRVLKGDNIVRIIKFKHI
ncbi:MAG: ASCH domain-containing protein [Elusimicrobiales bacterium]|nr:ASCH domain-containing protein [Elusimicrobiales bacterium]